MKSASFVMDASSLLALVGFYAGAGSLIILRAEQCDIFLDVSSCLRVLDL